MTAAVAAGRVWSPMQQAVFDAVADSSPDAPHLVVEALAGSGKTTTIVEALRHAGRGSKLMVAFNKAIAEELADRVPAGVDVRTLHSFGLRAITKAHGKRGIDGDRWRKRCEEMLPGWHQRDARGAICKLVGLAKANLSELDPESLDALADSCEIDLTFDECSRGRATAIASRLLIEARDDVDGPVDFDDMVWLPIVQGLPIPRYDWVFVDETQDLNANQLELVVRAAGSRGRICAIGDRRQAIYGFRGADAMAIPRMIDRLDAEVLPLSVTYRCPISVVREAAKLVPALQAAPGALEGEVRSCDMAHLRANANPGDFVLSRTNAPLITLCLQWLSDGRKATIRGREIGAGLLAWVRKQKAPTVDALMTALRAWESNETRRLTKLGRDTQHIAEKAACIEAISEGASSVDEVLSRLDFLFADKSAPGIQLMSTHKSKGLEADRVWLLRDTYCKWDGAEEENLLYVALTRAKRELIYVREAKPPGPKRELIYVRDPKT